MPSANSAAVMFPRHPMGVPRLEMIVMRTSYFSRLSSATRSLASRLWMTWDYFASRWRVILEVVIYPGVLNPKSSTASDVCGGHLILYALLPCLSGTIHGLSKVTHFPGGYIPHIWHRVARTFPHYSTTASLQSHSYHWLGPILQADHIGVSRRLLWEEIDDRILVGAYIMVATLLRGSECSAGVWNNASRPTSEQNRLHFDGCYTCMDRTRHHGHLWLLSSTSNLTRMVTRTAPSIKALA
jgi:hypothetical protein